MHRWTVFLAVLMLASSSLGTPYVPAAGACPMAKQHACCKHKHRASGETPTIQSSGGDGRCCQEQLAPSNSAVLAQRPGRSFGAAHSALEAFYPTARPAPAPDAQSQRAPPARDLVPQ